MTKNEILISEISKCIGIELEEESFDNIMYIKGTPVAYYEINAKNKINKLFISNSLLTKIPQPILNLVHLEELYLPSNKIETIPEDILELQKIQILDLSNNEIKHIPSIITKFEIPLKLSQTYVGDAIVVSGNPIISPPLEIIKSGLNEIKNFYIDEAQGSNPVNEVKVIIVGDGGAGKTSLNKQIVGEKFLINEARTHGIRINRWTYLNDANETIVVNFWDFGGQEILHATHQFFLTKRSLYILVLDGRKEGDIEYWLKHIQSFGGLSPILVVLNKIDENHTYDLNRSFLINKYINIKDFFRVSCLNGIGIKKFIQSVKTELQKIEFIKTLWPNSWLKIKLAIEKIDKPILPIDEFTNLCIKHYLFEINARQTLIGYLRDLGVILYFDDFGLADTQVLNPEWTTNAVYKILNSTKLTNNDGRSDLNELFQIIKNDNLERFSYSREHFRFIIALMCKFELCYLLNTERIIIPDLLPIQEPSISPITENSFEFLFDYDYLPRSIISRIIVKLHEDIFEDKAWRSGVLLINDKFKSKALIIADYRQSVIHIKIEGLLKRDYFSVILHAIREINGKFEIINVKEKILVPNEGNVYITFEHLLKLEELGITEYLPDGANLSINVKKLIGNIQRDNDPHEELKKLLNEVRSSHKDNEEDSQKINDLMILKPYFKDLGIEINEIY